MVRRTLVKRCQVCHKIPVGEITLPDGRKVWNKIHWVVIRRKVSDNPFRKYRVYRMYLCTQCRWDELYGNATDS